jgi:hypothetical protein
MDEHDLTLLLQKMAVVFEQLSRDGELAQQDLRQCAERVPEMVRQSLQEQLHQITEDITVGVGRGLGQPLMDCEQQLSRAGDKARDATQVLADEFGRVETLHRHLIWKVSGVVLGALALVLGGAIWLSMYYIGVIRDNQVSAELLKAYNAADVALCEGRLCARIGKKYIPVESR